MAIIGGRVGWMGERNQCWGTKLVSVGGPSWEQFGLAEKNNPYHGACEWQNWVWSAWLAGGGSGAWRQIANGQGDESCLNRRCC
mmetsp:Transcript_42012/g.59023  ORF Transcript_42012/g.59023 Transcript_42012/m.59023 type:complete len:84 (-) Transcript_42012:263-514(-)